MRIFLRLLAVLLCMSLLTGCAQESAPTQPTEPTDPNALYLQATEPIRSAKAISYRVEAVHSVTVGTDTYLESSSQTVCYKDIGTDTFSASVTEDTAYGKYQVQLRDLFLEGARYLDVNGSCFFSAESSDAFTARYAPAILIDASLYNSVTCNETEDGMTVTFAQATAAESWLGLEKITDAYGSAVIRADGTLLESRYCVTFPSGNTTVTKSYTVTMISSESPSLPDPEAYIPLDAPQATKLLEAACGYLSQAGNVTSQIKERLFSQAAGLTRDRESHIRMASTGGKFLAQLDHDIRITDDNRGGMISSVTYQELHRDGRYTLDGVHDGRALSPKEMYAYITNLLVEHVLLPQHLTQAAMEVQGGSYLLKFNCSEALAQILGQLAAKELLEDAHVLNDLADSYRTISITGWLRTDAVTGLPLEAGVDYQGQHTIGGNQYTIAYQLQQSFCLGSEDVRASILSD